MNEIMISPLTTESNRENFEALTKVLPCFELSLRSKNMVLKAFEDSPFKSSIGLTAENGFRRYFEVDDDTGLVELAVSIRDHISRPARSNDEPGYVVAALNEIYNIKDSENTLSVDDRPEGHEGSEFYKRMVALLDGMDEVMSQQLISRWRVSTAIWDLSQKVTAKAVADGKIAGLKFNRYIRREVEKIKVMVEDMPTGTSEWANKNMGHMSSIRYKRYFKPGVLIAEYRNDLLNWCKDILPKVDETYANRASLSKCTIMVSDNPVDKLMCSTAQSFSSCMSLESDHSDAFYMGLPFYMANERVLFMAAITRGFRSYDVCDARFKVLRYKSRSFVPTGHIISTDGKEIKGAAAYVMRIYPCRHNCESTRAVSDAYASVLEKIGFRGLSSYGEDWSDEEYFAAPTRKLSFYERTECLPYIDNMTCMEIKLPGEGHMMHEYTQFLVDGVPSSTCGTHRPHCFSYTDGFKGLVENGESIFDCNSSRCRCDRCGAGVDEDDAYSVFDETMCASCYRQSYSQCEMCGDDVQHNDLHEVESLSSGNRLGLCAECAENSGHVYTCRDCEDVYHSEHDPTANIVDGDFYCPSCRSDLEEVYHCSKEGGSFFIEDAKDKELCGRCESCGNGCLIDARDRVLRQSVTCEGNDGLHKDVFVSSRVNVEWVDMNATATEYYAPAESAVS